MKFWPTRRRRPVELQRCLCQARKCEVARREAIGDNAGTPPKQKQLATWIILKKVYDLRDNFLHGNDVEGSALLFNGKVIIDFAPCLPTGAHWISRPAFQHGHTTKGRCGSSRCIYQSTNEFQPNPSRLRECFANRHLGFQEGGAGAVAAAVHGAVPYRLRRAPHLP